MKQHLRIAVLASHGGSNLQALIDGCASGQIDGEIVLVVSNNKKAFALERARNHHIDTLIMTDSAFATPEEYALELLMQLERRGVNLICLAGYMKRIPESVVKKFRNRIVNIHPALLPKHGGKGMFGIHVHQSVIAAGERETGVTIHLVNEVYDDGKIIAQRKVPVNSGDTPQALQERVLELEHQLYPETVARIAAGEISLE
ncbi:MAG: phosphoribosylglycinamide formyltransferase [Candidatus Zixiibacteriota bacterium]